MLQSTSNLSTVGGPEWGPRRRHFHRITALKTVTRGMSQPDSSGRNRQPGWWVLQPASRCSQAEGVSAFYIFLFSEALFQPVSGEMREAGDK